MTGDDAGDSVGEVADVSTSFPAWRGTICQGRQLFEEVCGANEALLTHPLGGPFPETRSRLQREHGCADEKALKRAKMPKRKW